MRVVVEALTLISGAVDLRAWLTSSKDTKDLDARFQRLESGLYLMTNQAMNRKQNQVELRSDVKKLRNEVHSIQRVMDSHVGLVNPTRMQKDRFKVLQGLLEDFIAKDVIVLDRNSRRKNLRSYRIVDGRIPVIWSSFDGHLKLGAVPESYMKDYFGIDTLRNREERTLHLREQAARKCTHSVIILPRTQELKGLVVSESSTRFKTSGFSTVSEGRTRNKNGYPSPEKPRNGILQFIVNLFNPDLHPVRTSGGLVKFGPCPACGSRRTRRADSRCPDCEARQWYLRRGRTPPASLS